MCASIGLMLYHRLVVDKEFMQQWANIMFRLWEDGESLAPEIPVSDR